MKTERLRVKSARMGVHALVSHNDNKRSVGRALVVDHGGSWGRGSGGEADRHRPVVVRRPAAAPVLSDAGEDVIVE